MTTSTLGPRKLTDADYTKLLETPLPVDVIIRISSRKAHERFDLYQLRMSCFALVLRYQIIKGLIVNHGDHLKPFEEFEEFDLSKPIIPRPRPSGTFLIYPTIILSR